MRIKKKSKKTERNKKMKNKIRITLDIIMLALTVTLFSKNLISLAYHEIAGLILIGIIIVHIAINLKIIKAMCCSFSRVPLEIKIGIIIDMALILCFAWIGISSIFISHTILTSISSGNIIFKLGHMFAGGLSVILLGVHIGLHICRKPMRSLTSVIISAIVLLGGIYGIIESNELRWLSIPATAALQSDDSSTKDSKKIPEVNKSPSGENASHENKPDANRSESESGRHTSVSPSPAQKISVIFMYTCMILLCSMITYWIVLAKRRHIKKFNSHHCNNV